MERISARAVIITEQDTAVLIYRNKDGNEYYVIPGGGVEEGETPENAVIREANEELGIKTSVQKRIHEIRMQVGTVDTIQIYFLCKHEGGEIGTGKGPEFHKKDPKNIYRVVQVTKDQVDSLNILPSEMKDIIVKAMNKEDLPDISQRNDEDRFS